MRISPISESLRVHVKGWVQGAVGEPYEEVTWNTYWFQPLSSEGKPTPFNTYKVNEIYFCLRDAMRPPVTMSDI